MKTKILLAGLCTSVAFVSCTNEDLLGVENTNNSQTTDFALVFDGMNVPSSRMAYNNGNFKWQAYEDTKVSDKIGVCRTIDGVNVVSNSKFYAIGVSDDNTSDPTKWGKGEGKYAYFKTDVESIFEGNYVVTYPWNSEMTKDGKITATLSTTQKAEGSEEENGNDNYVSNYGFMMSEATSFTGGQTTGHFVLYPVLSRLKFNVTANGTAAGAKLQSIVLRTKDGSKTIPTELEIPANVKETTDGYLDFSMMSVKEDSKVSQIVLTMNGTNSLDATKAAEYYMTLLPGTYDNIVIDFITDKGVSTYGLDANTSGTKTLSTGRYATIKYDIKSTEACSTFYVATSQDWSNAVANINKSKTNGTAAEIVVLDDVTISQEQLRNLTTEGNHDVTINGTGTLSVDGDYKTKAIKDVVFNVPVIFESYFQDVVGDNVVFNKGITAKAGLHLAITGGSTYVVNGGTVGGSPIYLGRGNTTLNNVTFTDKVQTCKVDGTTQKLTFNNCKFEAEVTEFSNNETSSMTINSCSFDDNNSTTNNGGLRLTLGSTVTFTGDSKVEYINVQNGSANVIVKGNLTISNKLVTTAGTVKINKDAVLTLDKNVNYTYNQKVLVEGKLVNKGIITISNSITDIDQDNSHKGDFDNQGLVYVAYNKNAYESQNINYYNNGDMYVTGVTDKTSFNKAIENKDVTGVQITGDFDFSTLKSKDYSAYDVELSAANKTIIVPNGLKLANVIVKNNATIKGQTKNASISTANLDIQNGNLTINNSTDAAVINAINVNVDGTLTNGSQVTYTGNLTYTGTISGMPVKK